MPNILEELLSKIGQSGTDSIMQGEEYNPFQKGVEKATKEFGYNSATEALQQGIPPEHIMQQAKIMQPKGAFDKGGIVQDEQGNITGIQKAGWVTRLGQGGLSAMGVENPNSTENVLNQLLKIGQIQQIPEETKLKKAEASQKQSMADLYSKGIMHIDQSTGQATTADNPNSVTLLPLPNGQIIQLDKMADYKQTLDGIEKRRSQLEKDREDLIKLKGQNLLGKLLPIYGDRLKGIENEIKTLDTQSKSVSEVMQSKLKKTQKTGEKGKTITLPSGKTITLGQ